MMLKSLSLAAATVFSALALSAPVAHAGLINNYTFDGVESTVDMTPAERTFAGDVAGGPSVTVTGYLLTGSTWGQEEVRRNGNALGVNSYPNDTNGAAIIGYRVEGLLFDLGSTVNGSFTLNFSQFTGSDSAAIWVSDSPTWSFSGATQLTAGTAINPFTANDLSFRYIFVANTDTPGGACATGSNQSTSNCFRVDNLQVVSAPGSLALLSTALLLAGTQRRRRSVS
jgi:hypothetical protein